MAVARSNPPVSADLVSLGLRSGLHAVGVCRAEVLEPARSVLAYRKEAGLAGSMQFTYRNPVRSTEPDTVLHGARSWVVAALTYPVVEPFGGSAKGEGSILGRIARYSWDDHYQHLADKLEIVANELRSFGYEAVVVADTNKLVDRNVAWKAGLGWYGKNANLLLSDLGSWCVLGTVVTNAELEATGAPIDDGCGRCTSCIDHCPTDAIIAPGVVDATACIAWLVQAGGPIPIQYRVAVGDRLYGCDDCQTVCPPNRHVEHGFPQSQTPMSTIDIIDLLAWDDEEIERRCGRWYIANRDMNVIRRTALVVLGNTARPDAEQSSNVVSTLTRFLASQEPLLRSHALWAARRLGLDELLGATVLNDEDPLVAGEWDYRVQARFTPDDWSGASSGVQA